MSFLRASSSFSHLASTFASSSSSVICNTSRATAALHTSASRWAETQRHRAARITRKANLEKKAERGRIRDETKPHVVLGTRPGDEEKWRSCDLAKILVTPEELNGTVWTKMEEEKEIKLPMVMSYGLEGTDAAGTKDEKIELFFKDLPQASVNNSMPTKTVDHHARFSLNVEKSAEFQNLANIEYKKSTSFARVLDLRNANARGIAFENRRRIIAAFSPSGSMSDSGYPEVQVALLTMKIRNVWDHLMQRKKDISGRRDLRMLVHQRAKLLKYIKRVDRDRYDIILQRLALEAEAVEGELVV